MPETPAYVVDAKYDVLAWNQLATFFIGDLSGIPEQDRNMIRWMFRQPAAELAWSDEATLRFVRATVGDLRAGYARNPADRGIATWSPSCSRCPPRSPRCGPSTWSRRAAAVKRVDHPLAGQLEFECHMLHVADTGQRLIVYCAAPGSTTRQAFARLAALGSVSAATP